MHALLIINDLYDLHVNGYTKNINALHHCTSMVCLGGLTEGGVGCSGALWLARGRVLLNFC